MGERGIVLEFLHILFKPSPSVVTDTSPKGRGFLINRKVAYHHAVLRVYHQNSVLHIISRKTVYHQANGLHIITP